MSAEEAERLLNETSHAVTEGGTPLRCIRGRVEAIVPNWRAGSRGAYLQFTYTLMDLEVCSGGALCGNPDCKGSVVPYPWKQADLPPFSQASSSQSRWGVWCESINGIIGADFKGEPVPVSALKGKLIHAKFTSGHVLRQQVQATGTWGEVAADAWEVLSIDGRTKGVVAGAAQATATTASPAVVVVPPVATDPETVMISLMDGKTQVDFNPLVLTNQIIKDSPLFTEYVGAQEALMQRLIGAGKVTRGEDGVYHKV